MVRWNQIASAFEGRVGAALDGRVASTLQRRVTSNVEGQQVIVALGALYVAIAVSRTLVRFGRGEPFGSELVTLFLVAGPGFVLLYGGFRLPRTDIRPELYSVAAAWCVGAVGLMVGILVLYEFSPTVDLTYRIQNGLILTALSSVAGFAVGIHDARAKTRARELEETVEELQVANERLEQFAYAVSHDLQEPLRMVSSYLRLIEQRYEEDFDEDGEEFLEFAVDGADRMREMIESLLTYSRIETQGDPFEAVDLNEVLEEVRQDLHVKIAETDAEVTADDLPQVAGDAEQIRQVFQNLIANALEYSGDEPPRVHVSAEHGGVEWTVSVRDEGVGIDPDEQDRIFEVFQRLHSREEHAGTGIGLALCERIVERHGGEIWVDSEPGEGATFSFTLPAVGTANT